MHRRSVTRCELVYLVFLSGADKYLSNSRGSSHPKLGRTCDVITYFLFYLFLLIWEKTPGQTKDQMEGLHLLVAWERLGIPQEDVANVSRLSSQICDDGPKPHMGNEHKLS